MAVAWASTALDAGLGDPALGALLGVVLAIGAGVAATTVITIAGHNGAKSVWEQKAP